MPGAVVVVAVIGAVVGCVLTGVLVTTGVAAGTEGFNERGVVVVAGVVGLLLSGAPTAISQRWPGCPCAGFMPGAVLLATVLVAAGIVAAGLEGNVVVTAGWLVVTAPGVVLTVGWLFNGAPTAISQRWPGLPCSGFNAPVLPVTGAATGGTTV